MPTIKRGSALPLLAGVALALGVFPASAATAADAGGKSAKTAKSRAKHGGKRAKSRRSRRPAARGGSVLSGASAPSRRLGKVGDVYLRTSDQTLWGPKTRRGWGRPVSLVGPRGQQGDRGAPGERGPQGPPWPFTYGRGVTTAIPSPGTIMWRAENDQVVVTQHASVPVSIPAGVSLVRLRVGGSVPGMMAWVGCRLESPYAIHVEGSGEGAADAPNTPEVFGWVTASRAFEATLNCFPRALPAGSAAQPGTAAGSNVTVFPTNVPLP